MAPGTAETMSMSGRSPERTPQLIVTPPKTLESLLETLAIIDRVSERVSEDRSGDMGGAGAAGATQGGASQSQQTARQIALQNLPDAAQMQKAIILHIGKEVKTLRREVRTLTRNIGSPGGAHKLNELYGKIRLLNAILRQMLSASYDSLKRLYVKVFVDRQTVLG